MWVKFAFMSDPSIRLFITSPLQLHSEVAASEAQSHYLANVMRRAVGDQLKLFNGRDGEWLARIVEISRRSVRLEPLNLTRPQIVDPDCWLCFALLKRQKTDLVVEKATELGASSGPRPTMSTSTGCGRLRWKPPSNASALRCRSSANR
jgi:16S rRNA (uracil1498-N3)-methyltransferase